MICRLIYCSFKTQKLCCVGITNLGTIKYAHFCRKNPKVLAERTLESWSNQYVPSAASMEAKLCKNLKLLPVISQVQRRTSWTPCPGSMPRPSSPSQPSSARSLSTRLSRAGKLQNSAIPSSRGRLPYIVRLPVGRRHHNSNILKTC